MTDGQRVFVNGALSATGVILGIINFKNVAKIIKTSVKLFKALGE